MTSNTKHDQRRLEAGEAGPAWVWNIRDASSTSSGGALMGSHQLAEDADAAIEYLTTDAAQWWRGATGWVPAVSPSSSDPGPYGRLRCGHTQRCLC